MTNDAFHSYTYDAEGNVTAVDGGATAQYVYDALNQRVRAVVGSSTTEYVFNVAGQRVSDWNGTTHAQLKGRYFWGAKPVAFYANGAVHFEHQDWLGTERMRTTYNAGVEGTFTSLPFGDGKATAGADGDASHYATLDYDPETTTDHAEFRQYSNALGHWLSPDPDGGSYDGTNPQSFNRYAYAANGPLASIDPSGLATTAPAPWNIDGGGACMRCGEAAFLAYNAAMTQANSGFFGNTANEFGSFTATWVQGHWADQNGDPKWVPGHWEFLFTYNDFGPTPPWQVAQNNAPKNPAPPTQNNAPNNGTPQQPQQQQNKPFYCGTGNSWSHPFTAPTSRQWGKWSIADIAVSTAISKYTGGKDPVSQAFLYSSIIEGWGGQHATRYKTST